MVQSPRTPTDRSERRYVVWDRDAAAVVHRTDHFMKAVRLAGLMYQMQQILRDEGAQAVRYDIHDTQSPPHTPVAWEVLPDGTVMHLLDPVAGFASDSFDA